MRLVLIAAMVIAGLRAPALGQGTMDCPTGVVEPYHLDSGLRGNAAVAGKTVFTGAVHVAGASWLRLYFGAVGLSAGSVVRMTSALDGQAQELDAQGLAAWGNSSAYFNGDTVIVELVAAAGATRNRIVVEQIARPGPQPEGGPGDCGICGSDDRVPSNEGWAGRLLPAGCTASVYNEASCLVSAGHCIGGGMVVEFNVPDSDGDCSINHPPVADQFPIADFDFTNGGVGNDWSVLVAGTNNLGELPYDRYGELRPIAGAPVSPGAPAAVWGFGVDNTCTHSQAQQTSAGSIVGANGTTYEFEIDIRGGNSGSSLIHDGGIIGIVTHCNSGGCPAAPNLGTRIDLPSFVAAREALCGDNLHFAFPAGLPERIEPAGGTSVRVLVQPDTGVPAPGTGMLHVSIDGGPFSASAMTENAPNEYDAVFPAVGCPAIVEFYFSAETAGSSTSASPAAAPGEAHSAFGASAVATRFDDDFETDLGWTVSGTAADGQWQRGVPLPLGICDRGNPGADADGSGQCFLTDNSSANSCNSDVDAGSTILTSPLLDAADPEAYIEYRRWFDTGAGSAPFQDVFAVEVSGDGGSSWTALETVGPAGPEVDGGWFHRMFRVAEYVVPSSQFRIRFTASDADPQSVVEAAVDGVLLVSLACEPACPWDLDGNGDVNVTDLLALLGAWGTNPGGPPDFDGDGAVTVSDLLKLLGVWGPCL